MSKEKLNKVAKLYTAASAMGDGLKSRDTDAEKDLADDSLEGNQGEADRSPSSEKRSKKLNFNENRGGMRSTIYKDSK